MANQFIKPTLKNLTDSGSLSEFVSSLPPPTPQQTSPAMDQYTQDLIDAGNSGFVNRNLTAGVRSAGANLSNALAAVLDTVGAKTYSQKASEYADYLNQRAQPYTVYEPSSLSEANGIGGVAKYLTAQAVRGAPQIGAAIGGSLLASRINPSAVAPFVGAAVPNIALSTGQAYQETKDAGNPSALTALGIGTLAGSVDAILPGKAIGTALSGTGRMTAKELLASTGKNIALGAGTNTAQEALIMGAGGLAGKEYTGAEIGSRLLDAAVTGGALGGTLGLAGDVVGMSRGVESPQTVTAPRETADTGPLVTDQNGQGLIPGYNELPISQKTGDRLPPQQLDIFSRDQLESAGRQPEQLPLDISLRQPERGQQLLFVDNKNTQLDSHAISRSGETVDTGPLVTDQNGQGLIPGYNDLPTTQRPSDGIPPQQLDIFSRDQLESAGRQSEQLPLDISLRQPEKGQQLLFEDNPSGAVRSPEAPTFVTPESVGIQAPKELQGKSFSELMDIGTPEATSVATRLLDSTDSIAQSTVESGSTRTVSQTPEVDTTPATPERFGIDTTEELRNKTFAELSDINTPESTRVAEKLHEAIVSQPTQQRTTPILEELKSRNMDVSRAVEAGSVVVHDSVASAPENIRAAVGNDERTQAAFIDGKTHLFSESIPDGQAHAVLLHDLGVHGGIARALGEDGIANIVKTLGNLEKRGTPEARQIIQRARESVEKSGIDKTHPAYAEELLGYVVENAAASSQNVGGLKRLASETLTTIKNTLRDNGVDIQLKPADLVNMARASVRRQLSTPENAVVSSTLPTLRSVRVSDMTTDNAVQATRKGVDALGAAMVSIKDIGAKAAMSILQADGIARHWDSLFKPKTNDAVMAKALAAIGVDSTDLSAPRKVLEATSKKGAEEERNWGTAAKVLKDWANFRGEVEIDGVKYKNKEAISAAAMFATMNNIKLSESNFQGAKAIWDSLGASGQKLYNDAVSVQSNLRNKLIEAYEINAARNQVDPTIIKQNSKLLQSKMSGDYFPLQRTGDYFIEVYSTADEKVIHFEGADTRAQAELIAKQLKTENGEAVVVRQRSDMMTKLNAVNKDFAQVMRVLSESALDPAVKSALTSTVQDLIIRSAQSTSALKRFAERKNIAGMNVSQMHTAYAKGAVSSSRLIAQYLHDHEITSALNQMQYIAKELPRNLPADYKYDAVRAQQVVDTMTKARMDDLNYMPSFTNKMAQQGSRLAGAWFLSDASHFMTNLLQTPTITLPYLAARHSFVESSRAMYNAYGQLTKLLRAQGLTAHPLAEILPADGSPPNIDLAKKVFGAEWEDKVKFLTSLQQSQRIDIGFTHEVLGYTTGDINTGSNALFRLASLPAHASEVVNRMVTALTVYELNKTATPEVRLQKAKEALDDTQGNYSRGNRSAMTRSAIGKVMGQFQSYSINNTSLLIRGISDAFDKNLSPQERSIAKKTVGNMMLSYGLTAGVRGVPFVLPTLALLSFGVNTFGSSDSPPVDLGNDLENFLPSILTNGPLSAITNVDISSRTRHQLPFMAQDLYKQPKLSQEYDSFVLEHLGPMVGVGRNIANIVEAVGQGRFADALSYAPKPIANVARAGRLAYNDGAKDSKGAIIADANAWDAAWQLVGYKPTNVRVAQDVNTRANSDVRIMNARRAALVKDIADAAVFGADLDGAIANIQEYNKEISKQYPKAVIGSEDITSAVEAIQKHNQKIKLTGVDTPERYRKNGS